MSLATRILISSIAAFAGLLASHARAEIPSKAHIILVSDPEQREYLGDIKVWPKVCKALGGALRLNSGPWGYGIATSNDCAVVTSRPKEFKDWSLVISASKDAIQLELHFAGIVKPLATSGFKPGEIKLDVLSKPEFVAVLIYDILEQLPMLSRLGAVTTKGNKSKIILKNQDRFKYLLPPPVEILIYTLEFEATSKIWRPHVVATARRPDTPIGKVVTWDLDRAIPSNSGTLFLHDGSGRNWHGSMHSDVIASTYDRITTKNVASIMAGTVKDQFAGGFVGLRYGRSITTGQLVNKVGLFSILAELRGSPINGLRVYFDQWPSVSDTAELDAVKFAASRAVFGWSFGFSSTGIFDRMDLVPRIGRWSLLLDYNVRNRSGAIETVRFKTIGALSTGLEIGLEKDIGPVMLRLWAADDVGSNPLLRGLSTRVDDLRAGADLLAKGFNFSPLGKNINLTFLMFTLYENLSLRKKNAGASGEVAINALNLQIALLGGGLAVTW